MKTIRTIICSVVALVAIALSATAWAGDLRNASNSYIGKVESDGTVRNASNSYVGKAAGVPREWAAVLFFTKLL